MLKPWERNSFWRVCQIGLRFSCTLWLDLKVWGSEHVPPTGGVLLISNHQSVLDPVLVVVKLKRSASFFARASLFEHRFFAWLIRKLNAFPVRRGEGDVGAVREMIRRLNEGYAVNLYPEGTRTHDGQIGAINRGVALVVRKAKGIPIIPVVIDGSFQSWPRWRKLLRPYPVRLLYGPKMDLDGLGGDEIVSRIDTTLKTMLAELRQIRLQRSYAGCQIGGARIEPLPLPTPPIQPATAEPAAVLSETP
jgi:1-acyl-sn-glycerol-3-phosphate acyltransferase